ncbi:Bug family tripartite tricarboxylate transporter substrate binding protein [Achromobacter denitrificans]|uniref:Bug family tripartite tricarboxylate transporter substrate binding protein n=1 Tax=Achromobacter denitrificans TaxID=32002 RepID=UPI0023E8D03C|nr:tripartite tricarboxylate transporter substrate-binding protein [Achromobacter denitrificans]MDF3852522.1 tripartite tricarboxylate transporter substrate-binding protein [Achromobacter denitrificans]
MKSRLLHTLVCAVTLGACSLAVAGGDYPSQPLRLIVPFAPGGSTDVLARAVADGLRKELGQSVVVENRAGAGGLIGTEAVARADADGYTLGMATVSTMAVNPLLYGTKRVDPETQLKPVAPVATVPVVWMVNPAFPAQDFPQFLAELRAHPGKYSYGSPGVGSLGHLNLAAMNADLKVDVLHVPYRGMGPALTAAVGGEVQVQQDQYASAQSLIKAGKLRAIAVSAPARLADMPALPTMAELGYPLLNALGQTWFGLVAPAGTPDAVVQRLNQAAARALADPALVQRLASLGAQPDIGSPQAFADRIRQTLAANRKIIETAGIKLDE